jgi:hypothetical protein
MTSTPRKRFNPFSLDAINFLLADVRGALGPYLGQSTGCSRVGGSGTSGQCG